MVMRYFQILTTVLLSGLFGYCCDAATITKKVVPQVVQAFDNANGGTPTAGLIEGNDGNFYGTTSRGGANNTGTVFQVTSAGTLTSLHSFTSSDGVDPEAGLVQGSDSNLYGTTFRGGANDSGTVFQVSTTGVFTNLHSFTGGADGALPFGGLVQGSDGNFYGTTSRGGATDTGTVFQITSGGVLTTLYSFTGGADGATPMAGVVQGQDGNFYGTTFLGGTNNDGTVFQIATNGALTTLYQFGNRLDGKNPRATLVQTGDGFFYGTTYAGGQGDNGTVFKVISNSSTGVLNTVFRFTGPTGRKPRAALIQARDGYLYGTSFLGGFNYGNVFQLMSNGVLTTIYNFKGGTDGGVPYGAVVEASDGYFYGTTGFGGIGLSGVVFRLSAFPAGKYNGLAMQTNAPAAASSGFLNLKLLLTGSFMAKLTMGGVLSSFNGNFDVSGNATNAISSRNLGPSQIIMHLGKGPGSNEITGTVSNSLFISDLSADLGIFSRTNPCPVAGNFTFNITPADTNDTTVPQAFGYGTLRVNTLGNVNLSGVLGDGTKISAKVPVSERNTFPLYNALYSKKQGAIIGSIVFPFPNTNTFTGTLNWFKPATPTDHFYPAGFATTVTIDGSRFVDLSKGGPSFAGNALVTLGGGNLPSNIVKNITIASNGFVTVTN